jgi:hypothetical protein
MQTRNRNLRHYWNPLTAALAVAALALVCSVSTLSQQPASQDIPIDRDAILGHLNSIITWYRDVRSNVHSTGLPSDALYQENAQSIAEQAVQLAFQSARAAAALDDNDNQASNSSGKPSSGKDANHDSGKPSPTKKDEQQKSGKPNSAGNAPSAPISTEGDTPKSSSSSNSQEMGGASQRQNLARTLARVSAQIDDAEQKLEGVNKQLATAPRSKRAALVAQRDSLQGQLELNRAMRDTIQKMSNFLEGSADTGDSLEGSIQQLANSVPEVLAADQSKKSQSKPSTAPAPSNSNGLVGQSLTLFGQMRTMHEIDQIIGETDRLRGTVDHLRKPIRDSLVATIQRGRDLAGQASNGTNTSPNSAQTNNTQPSKNNAQQTQDNAREFQALTARFKQLSSATLPLS